MGEQAHPSCQVGREAHEETPDAVLLKPLQRQVPKSRVFRDADPVLAARPSAVSQLEIGELPAAGVRNERRQPVPVDVLEPELRAGVGPFAADDDTHPRRPAPEVHEAGELGNIRAITSASVGVVGRRPDVLGDQLVELDRVGEPAPGESGDELLRAAAPISADQDLLPRSWIRVGQLRERLLDDVDVVGRGVRARVPWAQFHRERLTRAGGAVVGERAERVKPEPFHERRLRGRFLGLRGEQHRVQVDDQRVLRARSMVRGVLAGQRPS